MDHVGINVIIPLVEHKRSKSPAKTTTRSSPGVETLSPRRREESNRIEKQSSDGSMSPVSSNGSHGPSPEFFSGNSYSNYMNMDNECK